MDQAPFVERYAWFGAMKNMQGVNPVSGLLCSSAEAWSIERAIRGGRVML
jgi:hypothetical protein